MTLKPNLGGGRRLTQCAWHNGPDFWVAWSPNGKRLAVRSGDYMSTMNPDGSGVILPGSFTRFNPGC
jgi:hypothetical protein